MDSRERTLLAINHERPDRIPTDFWASQGFIARLESELGLSCQQFMDRHDVDVRYIAGPEYVGPPLRRAGQPTDVWGVPRTVVEVKVKGGAERYQEVRDPPLANATSVEEVLAYDHWPSPDWFGYEVIEEQCDALLRGQRAVAFMGDRLNRVAQLKPAMYLRGVEQILVDMASHPEMVRAIFRKIREFYTAYLERILEASRGKLDMVVTGDDFGSQEGPLVSPAMWDEFLREGFAEYVGLIKSHGIKAMHHTCGSVGAIIPGMIACGLDILQSLQPEARGMDPAALKRRFGAELAFQGGVSVQKTMPFGGREEIRAEVQKLAEALGKGGGYIFCTSHNLQADTSARNAQELMAAYREFGRYSA